MQLEMQLEELNEVVKENEERRVANDYNTYVCIMIIFISLAQMTHD